MLGWMRDPRKIPMPPREEAPVGRSAPAFAIPEAHFSNGNQLVPPWPEGHEVAMFGMGCFWGAERRMWHTRGVYSTHVGYAGGYTPHPTYEEVCTGRTGHNEVVRVVFDPAVLPYAQLLRVFWESHDPTQGMRQGNDVGTQYRSGIYVFDEAQRAIAERTKEDYAARLEEAGYDTITTEIVDAPTFYYAEPYHQQYLAKNPHGYCGLGGTGVSCPVGPSL